MSACLNRPKRFGARSTQGCDAPDRKDPPTARRELRATPFDLYGYVRGLPQNGFTVKCTFTALTEKRPTEASCADYPTSWLPWVFSRHLIFGTVMHPELKRSIEHWDGRIESLPHYRGCQVFPGEADVMPMRCTCGVTILAQRRLLKLPLYYLIRFRWHARCAIRRIHPVLRWKQQKGKQRKVCRWIHALAQDWAFYRCAATNLCWCSSRTPKPTPTDVPASDAKCSASEIHSGSARQEP